MSQPPLRILMVATEMVPFAKTGGLADVMGALPKALRAAGHDVCVVMPCYGWIAPERFAMQTVVQALPVPIEETVDYASVHATMIADVPVWFVAHDTYFNRDGMSMYDDDDRRFVFFCRAALELTRALAWQPDVIHCHDWHTAIIPNWLRTVLHDDPWFRHTASLLTIHNLAFQGVFGHRVLEIAGVPHGDFEVIEGTAPNDTVTLLGRGIYYADIINTVSPSYAREILDPDAGHGLDALLRRRRDRLYGVLNGIDGEVYTPSGDRYLATPYSSADLTGKATCKTALQVMLGLQVDATIPLVSIISRLTTLKGFDLLDEIIEPFLRTHAVQLVVMGTGQQRYHDRLIELQARFPGQVAFRLTFDEALAHHIYAGADMFVMPSRVEPCGTSQMIAMRYGTVPIVHATGGLRDTVRDYQPLSNDGTGFVFAEPQAMALRHALERALALYADASVWLQLMLRGMASDFTWQVAAVHYIDLYQRAMAAHTSDYERNA